MAKNLLTDLLARHGVSDAHEFLDRSEDAPLKRAPDPDVRMRGGVHRMSDRKSVQGRISELKHV
jgi:hypothetical protein